MLGDTSIVAHIVRRKIKGTYCSFYCFRNFLQLRLSHHLTAAHIQPQHQGQDEQQGNNDHGHAAEQHPQRGAVFGQEAGHGWHDRLGSDSGCGQGHDGGGAVGWGGQVGLAQGKEKGGVADGQPVVVFEAGWLADLDAVQIGAVGAALVGQDKGVVNGGHGSVAARYFLVGHHNAVFFIPAQVDLAAQGEGVAGPSAHQQHQISRSGRFAHCFKVFFAFGDIAYQRQPILLSVR